MTHFEFRRVAPEVREQSNMLIDQLKEFGAEIEHVARNVGACEYKISFQPEGGVSVLIGLCLNDWQTGSDVVVETIGVTPSARGRGFGGRVSAVLKEWAGRNGLSEIRAVQVNNDQSRNFWRKNGFIDVGGVTGDFVWHSKG